MVEKNMMADYFVGYGPSEPVTAYLISEDTLTYSVITGPLDGIDTVRALPQ